MKVCILLPSQLLVGLVVKQLDTVG